MVKKKWSFTDIDRTSPTAPYLVFGPAAVAQVSVAYGFGTRSAFHAAELFVLGFISWSLIEYLLHRFSFHSHSDNPWMKPFNSGLHWFHHEAPADLKYVAAPMRLGIPVYLIFLGILYAVFRDAESVAYGGAGTIMGYLAYEWVHYSAHQRNPKTRVMRYLKRYHMIHHFSDKENYFGVTSPVFDYVFGTHPNKPTAKPRLSA